MLEECDQVASNTFFRRVVSLGRLPLERRPESMTWRFPGNGLRRLWMLAHTRKLSWALETSPDHNVVHAKVRMRAPGARTDLLRKPQVCDTRAAMEGGWITDEFREELARAPEIPRCVDMNSHADLLAKWLRVRSAEYFHLPARRARKPWIAKRTFALIAQKQPMFREVCAVKRELKRTLLRDCWAVWCSR